MIKVATAEYWLETPADEIFADPDDRTWTAQQPESKVEGKLLDYIQFKRESLTKAGIEAVSLLPKGRVFGFGEDGRLIDETFGKTELAVHLLHLWICDIVVGLYPEYHFAKAKAAHLLSVSTRLGG